jgi:hypothetical protein
MGKEKWNTYTIQKRSRDKSILRNKLYVKGYLENKSCVDCNNSDIRVLEFDHVRGIKLYNVSHMVTKAYKLELIKEEIDKCEIRCCNCHRIITHERRNNLKINQIQ